MVSGQIKPETRLVFGETIGNPGLEVLNIPAIASVAHEAGLPLMLDSPSPHRTCVNLDHGADLIVHSATKWLGGLGVAIGGLLVDGGKFDWEDSGLFPTLTEPYDGYHGLDFVEEFGPQAFIMRAEQKGFETLSLHVSYNSISPFARYRDLPLRMENMSVMQGRLQNFYVVQTQLNG